MGTSFVVELKHQEGYLYSRDVRKAFYYDPTDDPTGRNPAHKPNSTLPVIFRVWKAQGGETVVKAEVRDDIKQDGTIMSVDLLDPKLRPANTTQADIRVPLKTVIPPKPNAAPSRLSSN